VCDNDKRKKGKPVSVADAGVCAIHDGGQSRLGEGREYAIAEH